MNITVEVYDRAVQKFVAEAEKAGGRETAAVVSNMLTKFSLMLLVEELSADKGMEKVECGTNAEKIMLAALVSVCDEVKRWEWKFPHKRMVGMMDERQVRVRQTEEDVFEVEVSRPGVGKAEHN